MYFDSDGDDDDDDEGGELASYRTNTPAAPTKKLTREEEIESMKMRIVRLGKCPSILLGDFSRMSPRADAISCACSPSVSMKSKENTPSLKRRSPTPTPISVAHQAAIDTEKSHTIETERSKADQPLNPNGGIQKTTVTSATQAPPFRSMSLVSHHPVRKKPRTPLRESKKEELTLVSQKSPALHMVNTPVGSRKPAKDSSLAIVDLKRKIAELEHQEEERELRKLR